MLLAHSVNGKGGFCSFRVAGFGVMMTNLLMVILMSLDMARLVAMMLKLEGEYNHKEGENGTEMTIA